MKTRSLLLAPRTACLVCAALCLLMLGQVGHAAGKKEMVGTWYAELKESGDIHGKRYNVRRQLTTNRPDGTKVVTFRYYAETQLLSQVVTTYKWGADKDVYWTECQTTTSGGSVSPCSGRIEYDLISVSAQALRYKSRQSGIVYDLIRVSDGFRLP